MKPGMKKSKRMEGSETQVKKGMRSLVRRMKKLPKSWFDAFLYLLRFYLIETWPELRPDNPRGQKDERFIAAGHATRRLPWHLSSSHNLCGCRMLNID